MFDLQIKKIDNSYLLQVVRQEGLSEFDAEVENILNYDPAIGRPSYFTGIENSYSLKERLLSFVMLYKTFTKEHLDGIVAKPKLHLDGNVTMLDDSNISTILSFIGLEKADVILGYVSSMKKCNYGM